MFVKGAIALAAIAGSSAICVEAQIHLPRLRRLSAAAYTFQALQQPATSSPTSIREGFSAGFENQLGLEINGVPTGVFGLDNHSSSVGNNSILAAPMPASVSSPSS